MLYMVLVLITSLKNQEYMVFLLWRHNLHGRLVVKWGQSGCILRLQSDPLQHWQEQVILLVKDHPLFHFSGLLPSSSSSLLLTPHQGKLHGYYSDIFSIIKDVVPKL
jgi:hypothetical protein